ncbi:excinuclease ABC subunit UvrA [Myxococcota bacterium]|nr:excinuclease ABC subunit UvrA [Myxococcota bacterium]
MAQDRIVIRGAREHNLKNIDVDIPRDQLVVITGLSGSGKSSLAFDTIYAEGQRRYVESLSAYARQFLPQMNKPDVDLIEGLSPAISIEQKTTHRNPRSTVGTVTEIYDYLRLLYARIGVPHCFRTGLPIQGQTTEQMVDRLIALEEGTRIVVLAPVVRGRKGEYRKELDQFRRDGFVRVRIDGKTFELSDEIEIDKNKKHDIDIYIDRLSIREGVRSRLADSIETALKLGEGVLKILFQDESEWLLSQHHACMMCGMSFPEITPQMFSFNSPQGACPTCDGIGFESYIDPDLVIPNPRLSIAQGAIAIYGRSKDSRMGQVIEDICKAYGGDIELPFEELDEDIRNLLLHGSGNNKPKRGRGRSAPSTRWFEGIIPMLERTLRESDSEERKEGIEPYTRQRPCETCKGNRLRKESMHILVGKKDIAAITQLAIREALDFFDHLQLSTRDEEIARRILKEIRERLRFLVDVGLDYLSLARTAGTLSGGEAQRIRLATQIGSSLTGVLYVLDEPSIGLHPRDNNRLIRTLTHLRDLGNTVLVVEHDEETMRYADHLIDMGPGAGVHGGAIIAQGPVASVINDPNSLTGQYLSGARSIEIPTKRRNGSGRMLSIRGAFHNNLKQLNVDLPLGMLICVTGVSGSGKSSLIIDTLYRYTALHLHGSRGRLGEVESIEGLEHIDKVINIDQSPIGRTPRSNPATYVDLFGPIRQLFTQLPESKVRGYAAGRFSFNVPGGRCESCEGAGVIRIEMHFLPDVFVTCEACRGQRFNRETLDVKYKGKHISEVLDMSVEEALEFFNAQPPIRRRLETLHDVGLDYIKLGQAATTLSGGEAQRIKLSKELSRRSTGNTLYILDEPTTGLHFEDIKRLLTVLHRLVDNGNTVIVIEHQLDVIKTADWIIDIGPEGGARGGELVAAGTPDTIAQHPSSHTGRFLKDLLRPSTTTTNGTHKPPDHASSTPTNITLINNNAASTDKLNALSDKIATSTDKIATSTDKIATSTDKITTSTDKIATSTDKITTSTDKIATSTEKITASTEEAPTVATLPTEAMAPKRAPRKRKAI